MKISVIVPVYKAEIYLHTCIDSILRQTYRNFELILVDDGSPDDCPMICDSYAEQDNRIKAIHKQNGGVSSARNFGLFEATGDAISFVDADDFIAENYLECLCDLFEDHVKLSICGMNHFVFHSGSEMRILKSNTPIDMRIGNNEYWKIADNGVIGTVWGKLFDRLIIQSNHLSFNETMPVGEDKLFVLRYIQAMESHEMIAISRDALYYNRSDSVDSLTKGYIPNFIEVGKAINLEYRKMAAGVGCNSPEALKRVDKDTAQLIDYAFANAMKDSAPKGINRIQNIKKIIGIDGYKEAVCNPTLFDTSGVFRKVLLTESPLLIYAYLMLARAKKYIGRYE